MTKKKTTAETGGTHGAADPEFGGLFRGLGDFVSLLGKLAEAGEKHIERQGEFRVKGLGDRGRGVYGFSIRSGIGGGGPRVEPFGNVRSSDEGLVVDPVREPLVDVFDEGSEIVVTAELPGVSENDIVVRVDGDMLVIETNGARRYVKEVLLPVATSAKTHARSYNNGMLEIRVKKDKTNP